jgi:hypothetical protein
MTCFLVTGTTAYVGAQAGGVNRSTNNGVNWTNVSTGLVNNNVLCLAAIGSNLFAGTSTGVYRTTNNGTSWFSASSGLPVANVYSFTNIGTSLLAATDNGVYSSYNNGLTWGAVSSGLATPRIFALAATLTHAIAGSQGGGVWRRPTNEVILDVDEEKTPVAFKLEQNYPNPFNPATRIAFSVPASPAGGQGSGGAERHGAKGAHFTSLKVFDMLGREVATLVHEALEPGRYSIAFSAGHLASGVYVYRLQTKDFSEEKKMILTK